MPIAPSAAASAHPPPATSDSLEPNNSLGAAPVIPLGTATRPSLYPAGDVDAFAVDVPRGGRLDVRVTGVVDSRAYPWNGSPLPIDPIVELYDIVRHAAPTCRRRLGVGHRARDR